MLETVRIAAAVSIVQAPRVLNPVTIFRRSPIIIVNGRQKLFLGKNAMPFKILFQ
jgi:hypothetical protein